MTHFIPPGCGTGLIKRNYLTHPSGYQSVAPPFPASKLIDKSEWADRLAANRKNQSGLLDRRKANINILKSLNQGHYRLCWSFSTTKSVMYVRDKMGLNGPVLSGWWLAGIIKGWRDQGGWGAASLQEASEIGVATLEACPSYSSQYDNPTVRTNAAQNIVTKWWDGTENSSDNFNILMTCLLQAIPCVVDLNVMGHSMCAIDIKDDLQTIIYDNSWGTNGDPDGLYYGKGAYARPDGLVIPAVALPEIA